MQVISPMLRLSKYIFQWKLLVNRKTICWIIIEQDQYEFGIFSVLHLIEWILLHQGLWICVHNPLNLIRYIFMVSNLFCFHVFRTVLKRIPICSSCATCVSCLWGKCWSTINLKQSTMHIILCEKRILKIYCCGTLPENSHII